MQFVTHSVHLVSGCKVTAAFQNEKAARSPGRHLNEQLTRPRLDTSAVLPLLFRRPFVSDDIRAAAAFTLQRVGE